ncbi:MAG: hypothetical protein EAY81_11680 [Bacteroidetes bacterium]|nr:MAG: hypothetical protein EAY81_11680 [Bacteroidota bacterium]
MKNLVYIIVLACFTTAAYGQAAWIEPENPDVNQPVRIYCDISKATNAEAEKMKSNPDGPFYIWTWKPSETRADSLSNGTGDKPWKSSNENLIMKKDASKGANVWYFECIPTQFYGVTATQVYAAGISFLVKPKDGGGYGDPDIKTEDYNLVVEPPKLNRGLLYSIPSTMLADQITSLIYENTSETKSTMQNLADGDVYMHMIATAKDSASGNTITIEPAKFLKVTDNPKLQMKKLADGRFKLTMIPNKFLNVPAGYQLVEIEITVRKKAYASSADQTNEKSKLKYGCK